MTWTFSRREAAGMGLAAVAAAALSGCGSGGSGSGGGGNGSAGGAAWRYTDARGKRVTVDHRPRRIVAYSGIAGALWDYGVRCVGVYGPHSPVDGKPNPQSGDARFDGVASIGEQYGDFSIEKLLGQRPDLVLETSFVKGKPFYVPQQALSKIEEAVPVALVDTAPHNTVPQLLRRFTELASSLGGDPGSPQATRAQQRFNRASQRIRDRAEAKKNLRVMAFSGSPQQAFISHPDGTANLKYLRDLGVTFVDPRYQQSGESFAEISWEQLGNYPADVVYYDERPQAMTVDDMRRIPTFRDHPAVRAGQLAPWNPEIPFSYKQFAEQQLEPAAGWLDRFRGGLA